LGKANNFLKEVIFEIKMNNYLESVYKNWNDIRDLLSLFCGIFEFLNSLNKHWSIRLTYL